MMSAPATRRCPPRRDGRADGSRRAAATPGRYARPPRARPARTAPPPTRRPTTERTAAAASLVPPPDETLFAGLIEQVTQLDPRAGTPERMLTGQSTSQDCQHCRQPHAARAA